MRTHRPVSALTERDLAILQDLWLYRYLLTAQICRLHFTNIKVAQRAMRRLHALGVVDRFRSDSALRAGFRSWVFRLSGRGATHLAGILDLDTANLRPPRRPPGSMWFLDHHRSVTDFRIWLREACAASAGEFGYRYVPSYEEVRRQGGRARRIAFPVRRANRLLIPDGVFTLDRNDGRSALFLLEVDRGTEPLTGRHSNSIERKLLLYRDAYDERGEVWYGKLFGTAFQGFRMLWLVPDENRRLRLLEQAVRLDLTPLVWAGLQEVTSAAGDLRERAWMTEPGESPRAIVE